MPRRRAKRRTPDADAADADADTEPRRAARTSRSTTTASVVEKGGKRVRVEGLGRDREYDSFEQFVQDAPWLAGLVFLVVLLVFLVPLLIIVLLIWYKMRKNRMLNETMLKLAERGVVPPAEAMDAVASGNAADGRRGDGGAAGTPAVRAGTRAAAAGASWSDLRKGVILIAVGLALLVLFDDRRRHAQRRRADPAVRRHRLLRAVVLRGPHAHAAARRAPPAGG